MSRTRGVLMMMLLAVLACAVAEEEASPSAAIKAGILLNVAEFVEWPTNAFADATTPLVVGVVGKDPFGPDLDNLQGRKIDGRNIEVRRFKGSLEFRGEETPGRRQEGLAEKRNRKARELKACHILFISSSEKDFLETILKSIGDANVLTVGELPEFTRQGGMVGFVGNGPKVLLEINLAAAREARLKISSKLLSLSRVVGGGEVE